MSRIDEAVSIGVKTSYVDGFGQVSMTEKDLETLRAFWISEYEDSREKQSKSLGFLREPLDKL